MGKLSKKLSEFAYRIDRRSTTTRWAIYTLAIMSAMFFFPLALSFYVIDRTASGDTPMTSHLWPPSIALFICYVFVVLSLFSLVFGVAVWYGWRKDPLRDKSSEEHEALANRMTDLEKAITSIHGDLTEIKGILEAIRRDMSDNTKKPKEANQP